MSGVVWSERITHGGRSGLDAGEDGEAQRGRRDRTAQSGQLSRGHGVETEKRRNGPCSEFVVMNVAHRDRGQGDC